MIKIFTKVHCRAYLGKANDSVHIAFFKENGEPIFDERVKDTSARAYALKLNEDTCENVVIKDLSEFDGDGVEKVYRERIECEFDGFLVGYRRLNVKGTIGTDWYEDDYRSYGYCFRNITDRPKVGVVYFKNNCKRFVLPEDMEEVE